MRTPFLILPLVLLGGCPPEEHTHTHTHTEDPDALACELVEEDGTAVTAAATLEDAGDATISIAGHPWTVALQASGSSFVQLEPGDLEDAILFVDVANVVEELWHDGDAEGLPGTAPNSDCPEDIPEHYDLHFHAGTYVLELGPAAVDSLWVVFLDAEGHAHTHTD